MTTVRIKPLIERAKQGTWYSSLSEPHGDSERGIEEQSSKLENVVDCVILYRQTKINIDKNVIITPQLFPLPLM
jgi:hypothetical protein